MENSKSLQNILSNIHYFIEYILKAAYFDSRWNTQALENAIKWANYCEMISRKTCKKNVHSILKLNKYMLDVVKETPNCIIREGNVGFLYQSCQILLLLLIGNCSLPLSVFFEALDLFEEQRNNFEQALPHVLGMNCKELGSIIRRIESQKLIIHIDSWRCLAGLLLIKRMHKQREKCFNEEFFSCCMSSDQRLVAVLSALSLPEAILPLHTKDCQSFLADELNRRLQNNGAELWRNLWKQPVILLVAAADRQLQFFDNYLEQLLAAGHAMKASYAENSYTWLKSREICVPLDFKDLVSHVKLLLTIKPDAKQELLTRVTKQGCSVWDDILSECLHA